MTETETDPSQALAVRLTVGEEANKLAREGQVAEGAELALRLEKEVEPPSGGLTPTRSRGASTAPNPSGYMLQGTPTPVGGQQTPTPQHQERLPVQPAPRGAVSRIMMLKVPTWSSPV